MGCSRTGETREKFRAGRHYWYPGEAIRMAGRTILPHQRRYQCVDQGNPSQSEEGLGETGNPVAMLMRGISEVIITEMSEG